MRARSEGSEVELLVEETEYHLHRPAVAVLVVGAAGALIGLLWPLYPPLLALAPMGALLTFVAWLLVVSRLRSSGPIEFLELVAAPPAEDPHLSIEGIDQGA